MYPILQEKDSPRRPFERQIFILGFRIRRLKSFDGSTDNYS